MPFTMDKETGMWRFETEQMSGLLDPVGARHGVKTLTHLDSGVDVVHEKYDLLNLFLLFAQNRCMGSAREGQREVEVQGDRATVTWPENDTHRAALIAVYELSGSHSIDLSVTVECQWPYPKYEVFLSNYFNQAMDPWVYLRECPYVDPPDAPQWVAPEANDVFAGTGLVFPRDFHAARNPVDGRWTGIPALYQWNPQRMYQLPICMQVDAESGVAAVVMSRPEDCYAVVTGYAKAHPDDPFGNQNPMYLSLFGEDLSPGDTRTARVRLAVIELDEEMQRPLEVYEQFYAQ
jgi:hypothetical protein